MLLDAAGHVWTRRHRRPFAAAAREVALLVVPGGGAFADADPRRRSPARPVETTPRTGWRCWRRTTYVNISSRPGRRAARAGRPTDLTRSAWRWSDRAHPRAGTLTVIGATPIRCRIRGTSRATAFRRGLRVRSVRLDSCSSSRQALRGPISWTAASAVFCRLMSPRRSSRPTGSRN